MGNHLNRLGQGRSFGRRGTIRCRPFAAKLCVFRGLALEFVGFILLSEPALEAESHLDPGVRVPDVLCHLFVLGRFSRLIMWFCTRLNDITSLWCRSSFETWADCERVSSDDCLGRCINGSRGAVDDIPRGVRKVLSDGLLFGAYLRFAPELD